jgi:hypothetical protein
MEGGCLCGAVRWRAEGELSLASHCHCSRCRKVHGTAYGTYAIAPEAGFSLEGSPARFESSAAFARWFCPRCGSVTPGEAEGSRLVPLGGADGDPGVRPLAHIFAASKAPWFEWMDKLPRFDAYPPGMGPAPLTDRAAEGPSDGAIRGSCLCAGVAFELTEPATFARFCHCSRCRKARAAAFATNLFVPESGIRFTRGSDLLASYKIPEALRFTQTFCRACGGKVPRIDPARKLAVVPMGALDDDPGVRPREHIFVGSKAPWDELTDALPQHEGIPPG